MTTPPIDGTGNLYIPMYRNFQQDEEELKLLLATTYNQIASSLNLKINGIFDKIEVQTGSQYNDPAEIRNTKFSFRQMFYIDPAALTFNHGITGATLFTAIYGTLITNVPDFRPLPYVDVVAAANQTGIRVTATQVIISNGAGAPAITGGIVVLEYLKN